MVAASVEAADATAETDTDGRFTLRGLPVGPVKVRIVSSAHHNLTVDEVIEAGKVKEVEYRMNRKRYGAFESVVRGARERKEVAVHEVAVQELTTVPGTQGDVLKVIQDFPGVARAPFGLGLLIVRGSAPQDTVVYMDGVQIPLLFHFLALTAVVNSDVISGLDFFPGNFSAYYGNAMGGAVEIHTRDPKHEWHGAGHVDLYDGAAMVEGPVGDGSFFASVRRSWVDEVLKAVVPSGLTVAPVFYDYQVKYVHSLWGGQGSLFAFGSQRRARHPRQQHRAGDLLRQRRSSSTGWPPAGSAASRATGATTPSSRSATTRPGHRGGERDQDRRHHLVGQPARHRSATSPSERFNLQMGIDSSLRYYSYDVTLPVFRPAGRRVRHGRPLRQPAAERQAASGDWAQPGLFASADIALGSRLRVQPGLPLRRQLAASQAGTPAGSILACRRSSPSARRPSSRPRSASTPQAPQPQELPPRRSGTRTSPTSDRSSTVSASTRSSPSTSTSG